MSPGIDELVEAIDSLQAVDPRELTDAELHELVIAVQRQRHRLAAVAATTISSWDQRMVWADNSARSAAVRLANETSASPSSTNVDVRRARKLRSMPATVAALRSGDISPDHVDLLARANQPWRDASFADHEASLVEQCEALRFHDARRLVDYWCARADAVTRTEPRGKLECTPHNRDSARRDHGGSPRPPRSIDRLDELRCRLRWRFLREELDHPDTPEIRQ
jgi:hypothetical protein